MISIHSHTYSTYPVNLYVITRKPTAQSAHYFIAVMGIHATCKLAATFSTVQQWLHLTSWAMEWSGAGTVKGFEMYYINVESCAILLCLLHTSLRQPKHISCWLFTVSRGFSEKAQCALHILFLFINFNPFSPSCYKERISNINKSIL